MDNEIISLADDALMKVFDLVVSASPVERTVQSYTWMPVRTLTDSSTQLL